MEFFESAHRRAALPRHVAGLSGEPLAESAWLITSEESPLMFAASVLAYYDKLATSDNINFSREIRHAWSRRSHDCAARHSGRRFGRRAHEVA
jgi:hypothetical protein